ncbi:hypothetical protein LVJ82_07195 [Vitreoscilla massiliensis]|uniref:YARHG domain-containing protein n=1 Tax=Vitreoscilla massiliensis TaxID=1689272 RepID=A0ABY4E4Q6_9NEIS|nr:hypothetical protein [Vitreoscilla massiliensis]UOO90745.1 hypothetical protein LVJ82_07195 [Vitreoscilla massiliensis]
MKHLLGSLLAVVALGSSSLALADAACTNMARDLYSAQGYQQRCGYQLKQTPNLSAQFKAQKCDQTLSGADKNKVLNEVNNSLNQSFNASKSKSCDEGKSRFN